MKVEFPPAHLAESVMRVRPILFALALAACGSSTPTTSPPPPPGNSDIDVSGNWAMTFTHMTGGGLTCSTTGIPILITQSGATFTGITSSAWTLSCSNGESSTSSPETGAKITDGTINGTRVDFSLATSASTQSGSLVGGTISGTASWQLTIGGTLVNLSGDFTLTR